MAELAQFKRCSGCSEMLPATTENFHFHRTGKLGFQAACRRCRATERKASYHRDLEKNRAEGRVRAARLRKMNTERMRAWRAKNPEKVRAWSRAYWAEYRKDPKLRLHRSMSEGIRSALRGTKSGRRIEGLLGYTKHELVQHIERQFLSGMSWENYGAWHVDHILPRTMFAFSTADDPGFKACWALSNLRPMWAPDNIAKHNRRTHLL